MPKRTTISNSPSRRLFFARAHVVQAVKNLEALNNLVLQLRHERSVVELVHQLNELQVQVHKFYQLNGIANYSS
jgi:hypothetical protein